jgi:hypothetical protein
MGNFKVDMKKFYGFEKSQTTTEEVIKEELKTKENN